MPNAGHFEAPAVDRPKKLPRPVILLTKHRTLPCPVCKRLFSTYDAMDWHRRAKRH